MGLFSHSTTVNNVRDMLEGSRRLKRRRGLDYYASPNPEGHGYPLGMPHDMQPGASKGYHKGHNSHHESYLGSQYRSHQGSHQGSQASQHGCHASHHGSHASSHAGHAGHAHMRSSRHFGQINYEYAPGRSSSRSRHQSSYPGESNSRASHNHHSYDIPYGLYRSSSQVTSIGPSYNHRMSSNYRGSRAASPITDYNRRGGPPPAMENRASRRYGRWLFSLWRLWERVTRRQFQVDVAIKTWRAICWCMKGEWLD